MITRAPKVSVLAIAGVVSFCATPLLAQCTVTLSPNALYVGKSGGGGTFSITTGAGCPWSASSDSSWLMITSSASGAGSSPVSFSMALDGGPGRAGNITVGGQTFVVTQTQDNVAFIQQIYQDLLDRPADPAGQAYWQANLAAGITRPQMAATLMSSSESINYGLWVIRAYAACLARNPDLAGWQYWMSILQQGVTQDSIVAFFVTSPEFQNTYGSLDNGSFVNLVYQNVLGRAPDTGGYAFWVGELNSALITRGQMMNGFINSPEFIAKMRAPAEANLLYMGLLRQVGSSSAVNAVAAQLAPGDSALPAVIASFLANSQYVSRF